MRIPSEFLSPDFWRRLLQMANFLMISFPRDEYDNDTATLAEDLVQETWTRILAMKEPDEPIQNWPGYFFGVMRLIFLEERRKALAGARRVRSEVVNDETGEVMPLTETIPDEALRGDELMELREEEEIRAVEKRQLKKAVDQYLWQIIDEEIGKISVHPAFRTFIERCWLFGDTPNAAWEFVKNRNPDRQRATYYRRYETLRLAVMKRWTDLVAAKGVINAIGVINAKGVM